MSDSTPEIVTLEPQHAVTVRGDVAFAELGDFFAAAFSTAAGAAQSAGAQIVGAPFGFYPELPGERVLVEAGFPVSAPAEVNGEAHPLELPGGRAVEVVHVGPYETLAQTYEDLTRWMHDQGVRPAGGPWESYLTDPGEEPDQAAWRTLIRWPVE